MLAALNLIARFRESGRLRDYLLFIAAVGASLLTRPTAVYMVPAYGMFLVMKGGGSRRSGSAASSWRRWLAPR